MQKLIIYSIAFVCSILLPFFVFSYTGIDGFQFILIVLFAIMIAVFLGLIVFEFF